MAEMKSDSTAEDPYLLGMDIGTGGVRVGIFDRKGTPVVFEGVEFETHHPRPGRAEQDPETWWSGLATATRRALEEGGVSPGEISGIGVDATASTVLAVDEQGGPLLPAIMWMDVRASEEAARIEETGDRALKYSGYGAVSAEWGLPKVLWLKENEREAYDGAGRVCDCLDWINHRLTGEWASSINVVSTKYFYDRDEGGWPESLYGTVGADDAMEKFPPTVLDVGSVVGGLRREAAEELGLRIGTPVAQGALDAYSGALGLGVVEPGKLALITGSSHVMIGQSTGSVVAWFKKRYAGEAVTAEAQKRGVDPYVVLTEMAEKVPIGSDGLVVLDYFQGNRSPHTDPLARGMMWGLSLAHTPGHTFRAIIEGICYGTEHILRTMRARDFEPRITVVSGGPTKNGLWMQIHADVSNLPLSFTRVKEGSVLGSAMLAAVGAGIYPDIPAASDNMVHTEKTIHPNLEAHEAYNFYVDRYIETYPRMRELMHEMTRHEAKSDRTLADA